MANAISFSYIEGMTGKDYKPSDNPWDNIFDPNFITYSDNATITNRSKKMSMGKTESGKLNRIIKEEKLPFRIEDDRIVYTGKEGKRFDAACALEAAVEDLHPEIPYDLGLTEIFPLVDGFTEDYRKLSQLMARRMVDFDSLETTPRGYRLLKQERKAHRPSLAKNIAGHVSLTPIDSRGEFETSIDEIGVKKASGLCKKVGAAAAAGTMILGATAGALSLIGEDVSAQTPQDGLTVVETKLCKNSYGGSSDCDYGDIHIKDGKVIYTRPDPPNDYKRDMYLYNDGKRTMLERGVSGGWGSGIDGFDGINVLINKEDGLDILNIESKDTISIEGDGGAIDRDHVAYYISKEQNGTNTADIYLYKISDGSKTKVAEINASQHMVVDRLIINDSKIVLGYYWGGVYDIRIFDINTGEQKLLDETDNKDGDTLIDFDGKVVATRRSLLDPNAFAKYYQNFDPLISSNWIGPIILEGYKYPVVVTKDVFEGANLLNYKTNEKSTFLINRNMNFNIEAWDADGNYVAILTKNIVTKNGIEMKEGGVYILDVDKAPFETLGHIPQLNMPSIYTINSGNNLIIDLKNYSEDLDGDQLEYADDSPLFEIDHTTGIVNWTPNRTQVGDYFVTFSVSDGKSVTKQKVELKVLPKATTTSPLPRGLPAYLMAGLVGLGAAITAGAATAYRYLSRRKEPRQKAPPRQPTPTYVPIAQPVAKKLQAKSEQPLPAYLQEPQKPVAVASPTKKPARAKPQEDFTQVEKIREPIEEEL